MSVRRGPSVGSYFFSTCILGAINTLCFPFWYVVRVWMVASLMLEICLEMNDLSLSKHLMITAAWLTVQKTRFHMFFHLHIGRPQDPMLALICILLGYSEYQHCAQVVRVRPQRRCPPTANWRKYLFPRRSWLDLVCGYSIMEAQMLFT